jgi:hypothetical protein
MKHHRTVLLHLNDLYLADLCGNFAGEVLSLYLADVWLQLESFLSLPRRRLLEINKHSLRKFRRSEIINCAGVEYFSQTFKRPWVVHNVPAQQSNSLRSQLPRALRDTGLYDF